MILWRLWPFFQQIRINVSITLLHETSEYEFALNNKDTNKY